MSGRDPSAIRNAGQKLFNVQSAGETGTGNLESRTGGKQVFRGITTETDHVQARSIHS